MEFICRRLLTRGEMSCQIRSKMNVKHVGVFLTSAERFLSKDNTFWPHHFFEDVVLGGTSSQHSSDKRVVSNSKPSLNPLKNLGSAPNVILYGQPKVKPSTSHSASHSGGPTSSPRDNLSSAPITAPSFEPSEI
uniref:Uncharacterized protein n=1 Tax=Ditylum brightwellii TaxID=49249 RepID=A0A7S4R7T8_9STRA